MEFNGKVAEKHFFYQRGDLERVAERKLTGGTSRVLENGGVKMKILVTSLPHTRMDASMPVATPSEHVGHTTGGVYTQLIIECDSLLSSPGGADYE